MKVKMRLGAWPTFLKACDFFTKESKTNDGDKMGVTNELLLSKKKAEKMSQHLSKSGL